MLGHTSFIGRGQFLCMSPKKKIIKNKNFYTLCNISQLSYRFNLEILTVPNNV